MKKRFGLFIFALVLITVFLSACGGTKTYSNIAAQSNPYSMGTQSIEIKASTINADEPSAKFKQSISVGDIEIGQALEGKTVTKVTYNSESSITVELSGNAKAAGGEGVYGTITVKQSGMESKGNSTCTVNLRAAALDVVSMASSKKIVGDVTTYNISAKLGLPAGAFTDNAAEYVSLADGATGDLTAELSDGILVITVKNCSVANPTLSLKAEATTFAKEIKIKLAIGSSANI